MHSFAMRSQEQSNDPDYLTILLIILLAIGVLVIVLLLLRKYILKYWKIGIILSNQEKQMKSHELSLRRDASANFYKYLALGDKEKAYEHLLYMFYFDLADPNLSKERENKNFQELRKAYAEYFSQLGRDLPPPIL